MWRKGKLCTLLVLRQTRRARASPSLAVQATGGGAWHTAATPLLLASFCSGLQVDWESVLYALPTYLGAALFQNALTGGAAQLSTVLLTIVLFVERGRTPP